MRSLSLFLFCLLFTNCQISWYVKGVEEQGKLVPAEAFKFNGFHKSKSICLVSNIRYMQPLLSGSMIAFDPLTSVSVDEGKYRIQKPIYTGLDPEFAIFLKERLKNKANILLKTQIYGLPSTFKEANVFDRLKTPKSFQRYESLAKDRVQKPALVDVLNSYADIADTETEFLYGSEDPFNHEIANCDSYIYFTKLRVKQDSYNSILFLLTIGILPEFRIYNHYYDAIIRDAKGGAFDTKTFAFGHRKSLSWFYLFAFGLFNPVSNFDKDYLFSEESEEMFLDALTETMERSI
jgi:hypothetical protein